MKSDHLYPCLEFNNCTNCLEWWNLFLYRVLLSHENTLLLMNIHCGHAGPDLKKDDNSCSFMAALSKDCIGDQ